MIHALTYRCCVKEGRVETLHGALLICSQACRVGGKSPACNMNKVVQAGFQQTRGQGVGIKYGYWLRHRQQSVSECTTSSRFPNIVEIRLPRCEA